MKLELKVNSDEYFMSMILLVFVQYLLCIVVMFPASLLPNCTITRKQLEPNLPPQSILIIDNNNKKNS